MQTTRSPGTLENTLFRGVVWALVGAIFALVFVVVTEQLRDLVASPGHILLASMTAAALTALLYGSMRLTVMTANFTLIAMLVFTWGRTGSLAIESLVALGAFVGLVVGTLYGWHDKRSRIFCAEAKIVAGVLSGLLAGGIALLLSLFIDALEYPWLAMIIAPSGTLIYVTVAAWFVKRCHHWLPAVVNGGIVGVGIGSITGLFFMVMAGSLDPQLLASETMQQFVQRVERQWMGAALSCAAICFVVGALRSVLKVPWYNL